MSHCLSGLMVVRFETPPIYCLCSVFNCLNWDENAKIRMRKLDTLISNVGADGQRGSISEEFSLISKQRTFIVYSSHILIKGFTHLGNKAPDWTQS